MTARNKIVILKSIHLRATTLHRMTDSWQISIAYSINCTANHSSVELFRRKKSIWFDWITIVMNPSHDSDLLFACIGYVFWYYNDLGMRSLYCVVWWRWEPIQCVMYTLTSIFHGLMTEFLLLPNASSAFIPCSAPFAPTAQMFGDGAYLVFSQAYKITYKRYLFVWVTTIHQNRHRVLHNDIGFV